MCFVQCPPAGQKSLHLYYWHFHNSGTLFHWLGFPKSSTFKLVLPWNNVTKWITWNISWTHVGSEQFWVVLAVPFSPAPLFLLTLLVVPVLLVVFDCLSAKICFCVKTLFPCQYQYSPRIISLMWLIKKLRNSCASCCM